MGSDLALELASEVSSLLREEQTRTLVIGAVALAAHGYVRGATTLPIAMASKQRTLSAPAA